MPQNHARIADTLYADFIAKVVTPHVFSAAERQRAEGELPAETQKKISSGKIIDLRIPFLMGISGKGGYLGEAHFKRSARHFRNVSLLDHMLSVTRGALVIGAIDLAAFKAERIEERLTLIAAIAFLHDADKVLEMTRLDELLPSHIAELMTRYGIDTWLASRGCTIGPEDMLMMIHEVEVSRAGSLQHGHRILSPQEAGDIAYVRLADRLDGMFLDSRRTNADLVAELRGFGGLRTDALKMNWRILSVSSPHTPFLMADIQKGISGACREIAGHLPLIETFDDGTLTMILPEDYADEILARGTRRGLRQLSSSMVIDVNARGARDIRGGGSSLDDLRQLLLKDNGRAASSALYVHRGILSDPVVNEEMARDFSGFNMGPDLSCLEGGGQNMQPWRMLGEDAHDVRRNAAMVAYVLGCKEPDSKSLAKQVPAAPVREAELLTLMEHRSIDVPNWILSIDDKLRTSRQTCLAVLVAGLAQDDADLDEEVFGDEGLLRLWFEGDGAERRGLVEKIGDPGAALIVAAGAWFEAAASGTFIPGNEELAGRCHFLNIPLAADDVLVTQDGIIGINISAFSGRQGRPERFDVTKFQTLVSPAAKAEHRLRSIRATSGKVQSPSQICTPTTTGLFATLGLSSDRAIMDLNYYDMTRSEVKANSAVYPEEKILGSRVMFSRHMTIPPRTEDRISLAKMLITSALRMGRPVHVFQGLPVHDKGFVFLDFLPGAILRGLGGASLRIEQLKPALALLGILEDLVGLSNVGLDLALDFAAPGTRFGAACQIITIIDRMPEDSRKTHQGLRIYLTNRLKQEKLHMTDTDNVIIDFAKAMTRVQDAPDRNASNSERGLGMEIALEALDSCYNTLSQPGRETLIAAISGMIEDRFDRSGRLSHRGSRKDLPFPRKSCVTAAEIFVDQVLPIAFHGGVPASKARRVAMAIYQTAFEIESYRPRKTDDAEILSA